MKLTIEHPRTRAPERRYVLGMLLADRLGYHVTFRSSDEKETRITTPGGRVTLADHALGVGDRVWLSAESLPATPRKRVMIGDPAAVAAVGAAELPELFAVPGPTVHIQPEEVHIGYDLCGTAFYMLSRYEEVVRRERDRHGRFPASASTAAAGNFVDRPLVDELMALLAHALMLTGAEPPRRPRPALCLTHDLDRLRATAGRAPRSILGDVRADLQRRRRPGLAIERLRSWWRTRRQGPGVDMFCQHERLMDVAESCGTRAVFHLMACSEDDHDANYQLEDPHVRDIIDAVNRRRHMIGIHGGYGSYTSGQVLLDETQRLQGAVGKRQQIVWGRQHYLRWRTPDTWWAAHAAGLEVDTTLGYAEVPGFRAGTAIPFKPWDVLARRPIPITECPLIVMDQTVLTYRGGSWRDLERTCEELATRSYRHGGTFTFLVHNNVLDTPARRRAYRRLVHRLAALRDAATPPGAATPALDKGRLG